MLTCTEKGRWPDEITEKSDESELDRLVEHAAVCDYHRAILDKDEEAFLNDFRAAESIVPVHSRFAHHAESGSSSRACSIPGQGEQTPSAVVAKKYYDSYRRCQRERCPIEFLQVRWGNRSVAVVGLEQGGGAWHLRVERGVEAIQFWTFCQTHGDEILVATYPLGNAGCDGEVSVLSFANEQILRVSVTVNDIGFDVVLSCTPPRISRRRPDVFYTWYIDSFYEDGDGLLPGRFLSAGASDGRCGRVSDFLLPRLADLGTETFRINHHAVVSTPRTEIPETCQAAVDNPDGVLRAPTETDDHVCIPPESEFYYSYGNRTVVARDRFVHNFSAWKRYQQSAESWFVLLKGFAGEPFSAVCPLDVDMLIVSFGHGAEPLQGTLSPTVDNFVSPPSDVEEIEAELVKLLRGESGEWPSGVKQPWHENVLYETGYYGYLLSTSAFDNFPYHHLYPGVACLGDSYGDKICYDHSVPHLWQGLVEGVSISLLLSGLLFLEGFYWAAPSRRWRDKCGDFNRRTWRERLGDLMAQRAETLVYACTCSMIRYCVGAPQDKTEQSSREQGSGNTSLSTESCNDHRARNMRRLIKCASALRHNLGSNNQTYI